MTETSTIKLDDNEGNLARETTIGNELIQPPDRPPAIFGCHPDTTITVPKGFVLVKAVWSNTDYAEFILQTRFTRIRRWFGLKTEFRVYKGNVHPHYMQWARTDRGANR